MYYTGQKKFMETLNYAALCTESCQTLLQHITEQRMQPHKKCIKRKLLLHDVLMFRQIHPFKIILISLVQNIHFVSY